jgi:outer membrane protein
MPNQTIVPAGFRSTCISSGLACLLLSPSAVFANNLLDTYKQAAAQDTTVAAALHARDASIEVRPQALSAFLPQLNASADIGASKTYGGQSGSGNIQVDPTTGAIVSDGSGQNYISRTKGYSVTLDQAIWNFQSFYTLKQADVQVALAETTYRAAQQALILRVAQAYFLVLSSADTLRTNEAQQASTQIQLQQAKRRFDVGLAAITDVQVAQAGYDTAAAQVISANQALASAKRQLGVITGAEGDVGDDSFPGLQDEIPLPGPEPAQPQAWVDAANQSNYDLLTAKLNTEIAERGVSVQRAQYYPYLALQASTGRTDATGRYDSNSRTDNVALNLTVPIFQGGRVQSLVRQAEASYQQYRSLELGQLRTTDQQTRDAFQGVTSGIATVQANLAAVRSNKLALEAAQVGQQVGTLTEVDVLTANTNLYTAQRTYFQSRYDYLTQVLTLKQLAGRLTVNDLADIDRLLLATPPEPLTLPRTPAELLDKNTKKP